MNLNEIVVDEFSAYFHADDPSTSPEMIDAHLARMARDSGERFRHAVPPAERPALIALLRALQRDGRHPLHEKIAYASMIFWPDDPEDFMRFGRLVDAIIREISGDPPPVQRPLPDQGEASGLPGVTRVRYETGSEHVPTSNLGRVVLTLDGTAGTADIVHITRDAQQSFHASLPAKTWTHVVTTMQRCGFPAQPPMTPAVPDSSSTTLSWERAGTSESVVLRRSPQYRDVNCIMWAIVHQLAPEAADGVPAEWITADTRVENVHRRSTQD